MLALLFYMWRTDAQREEGILTAGNRAVRQTQMFSESGAVTLTRELLFSPPAILAFSKTLRACVSTVLTPSGTLTHLSFANGLEVLSQSFCL